MWLFDLIHDYQIYIRYLEDSFLNNIPTCPINY